MSIPPERPPESEFIVARALGHRYGDVTALSNCWLTVNRGSVLALAGPNGAGKSTLARIFAGFLAPSDGSVTVGGLDPLDFRRSFGIGYLPDEGEVRCAARVGEFLRLKGETGHVQLPVGDVATLLGVDRLAARRISTLSKGQWRLVLVAYATVGAPALVILDEPDAGLDPHAIDRLHHIIAAARAHGSTVVVLSHQMHEVEKICDRMVFLQHGAIAGEASASQLAASGARLLYRQFVRDSRG